MNNDNTLESLILKVRRLERQVLGSKEYEATVTVNEDPDKRNRVKAVCEEIWGQFESPWIIEKTTTGGSGVGQVFTPRIGDTISVRLRDGNPDAAEWSGGHRSDVSPIPEEFEDPRVNGIKTESGIVMKYDDNEGSWSVEDSSGNRVYIDGAGNVHIYGGHIYVHGPTDLNSESSQYCVVTDSVRSMCPFGWNHRGSANVKASDWEEEWHLIKEH